MSLAALATTGHTHGLIGLVQLPSPHSDGYLVLKATRLTAVPERNIQGVDTEAMNTLYVGFFVTNHDQYDPSVDPVELRTSLTALVELHATRMLLSPVDHAGAYEISEVVWHQKKTKGHP